MTIKNKFLRLKEKKRDLVSWLCLLAASTVIGLGIYGSSPKEIHEVRGIYSGYTLEKAEGTQYFKFVIPRSTEVTLKGDPSYAQRLKIGEQYEIQIEEPHFPWLYSKRITKVIESDSINKL